MTRLYRRILLADLADYEAEGWLPCDDHRGIKVEAWCDGAVETCVIWKPADESQERV